MSETKETTEIREPWSDEHFVALEPEIAELARAEQAHQAAQNRIVRIAHALRPGWRIDVQRRCWVRTETAPDNPTGHAEGAD